MSRFNKLSRRLPLAAGLVAPFFRRHGLRLAAGFGALLCVDFFQLLIPRFIKRAVDGLEAGTATRDALLRYAGWILLLAAGVAVCRFLWRFLILGFSRLVEKGLRQRLFDHLLTLDRFFYQRRPPGEIMALATNDLAAVQLACGMGMVACVDAVVMTVAALSFMAYIHPLLTAIAVLPMPLLAVLTRFLAARLHQRFTKVQEQFSRLTEFARTTINAIRLVKAYTQEEVQVSRFDRLGRAYVRDNLQLARVQGILFPVSGLVANTSLLLVFFFGGRLTIHGAITAGDFVAFISYLFMLTWPMMALGWVANLFQRGLTSLGRIREILDEKPALSEPPSPREPGPEIPGFIVTRLTFRYPGQDRPALADVSLRIGVGILGVAGRTGSGKTTLCQVLARLYPVADGVLFLGGLDVNRLPLAAVRGRIAYVPQDVVLFSDSIRNNIALGRPTASDEEIRMVARAAAIDAEIMALPAAYETRIGERGVKLSGGQRQRIALARALLLDRPIVIIDGGLSAVDMETEQRIIRNLGGYLAGKVCIVVSHRLAPLVEAREILVMEQGRIAARGTHGQLLEQNRFYATVYRYQTAAAGGRSPSPKGSSE